MNIFKGLIISLVLMMAAQLTIAAKYERKDTIEKLSLGKDQHGEKVKIEDLSGKVVVILFWETKRPESVKALEHFEKLQRTLVEDDLVVVAINYGDKKGIYKKVVRKLPDFTTRLVHDKSGRYARTFSRNRGEGFVLIDGNGYIDQMGSSVKERDFRRRTKQIERLIRKNKSAKRREANKKKTEEKLKKEDSVKQQ